MEFPVCAICNAASQRMILLDEFTVFHYDKLQSEYISQDLSACRLSPFAVECIWCAKDDSGIQPLACAL